MGNFFLTEDTPFIICIFIKIVGNAILGYSMYGSNVISSIQLELANKEIYQKKRSYELKIIYDTQSEDEDEEDEEDSESEDEVTNKKLTINEVDIYNDIIYINYKKKKIH